MESLARTRGKGKVNVMRRRELAKQNLELFGIDDLDVRISLIQSLIPLGLLHVHNALQQEVMRLTGEPGKHGKVNTRWGKQGGSVYLHGQKVPIEVPRVRSKSDNQEVPLESYHKLQTPDVAVNEKIFLQLLNGLSTHNYKESATMAPEVFGLSASSVSKRFRREAAKHLENMMGRSLGGYDFTALFIDGKYYAREGIVIALGITIKGKKVILGLEQMSAENSSCVGQFLDKLIKRGLRYDNGLLVVVDGSKGIIAAVEKKFSGYALIQRCREHKIRNVLGYLPEDEQKSFRIQLRDCYAKEGYVQAETALNALVKELDTLNPSAAASLREGISDTLALQKLNLNKILAPSFGTTNCIESMMSQLGRYTDKVDRWRNGKQIQEWAAAGLARIEPKLHCVVNFNSLTLLRERLRKALHLDQQNENKNEIELSGASV